MPMTEEETADAVEMAQVLTPVQISETLEDLIVRERGLLDRTSDPEMRAITLHNIAVLTAACQGYVAAAKQHGYSAEAKEGGEGEEDAAVDANSR